MGDWHKQQMLENAYVQQCGHADLAERLFQPMTAG